MFEVDSGSLLWLRHFVETIFLWVLVSKSLLQLVVDPLKEVLCDFFTALVLVLQVNDLGVVRLDPMAFRLNHTEVKGAAGTLFPFSHIILTLLESEHFDFAPLSFICNVPENILHPPCQVLGLLFVVLSET